MSDPKSQSKEPLTEAEIIAWLEKNPLFLQRHPEVLEFLSPPKSASGKGVVDFQHYMVKRLRDDKNEILETTREFVENSRANMNNLARIHNAVIILLEAHSFEDFIHTITMDFAAMLDVDIISLIIETDGSHIPQINTPGVRIVLPGTVTTLTKDKAIVLQSDIRGYEEVYGGGATLVRSQAFVRLTIMPETPPALLAFGSRDPELFQSSQATDLLSFLGKVIERRFRSWITNP